MKINVCIKGVGCDIVSIPRLEEKMANTRLADKLFTEYGQNYIADKQIHSAAGIWAAKEAVSKSLGTGVCCCCVIFRNFLYLCVILKYKSLT